jgi:hypothetical protein
MTRWWLLDGPRSAPAPAGAPEQVDYVEPAVAPPPLSPTELVAEVLEQLAAKEPKLVAELLSALARCSGADVVKLFGVTPPAPAGAPAGGCGENPHIEAEPAAVALAERPADGRCLTEAERLLADLKAARHDERGNRISPKLPSSFPRYNPQPTGSHWSR